MGHRHVPVCDCSGDCVSERMSVCVVSLLPLPSPFWCVFLHVFFFQVSSKFVSGFQRMISDAFIILLCSKALKHNTGRSSTSFGYQLYWNICKQRSSTYCWPSALTFLVQSSVIDKLRTCTCRSLMTFQPLIFFPKNLECSMYSLIRPVAYNIAVISFYDLINSIVRHPWTILSFRCEMSFF